VSTSVPFPPLTCLKCRARGLKGLGLKSKWIFSIIIFAEYPTGIQKTFETFSDGSRHSYFAYARKLYTLLDIPGPCEHCIHWVEDKTRMNAIINVKPSFKTESLTMETITIGTYFNYSHWTTLNNNI